jgi:hypothetical protein
VNKPTGKRPRDANNDQGNANKGSAGTNKLYDKNQGNRGKQLNPNQNDTRKD